MDGIPARDAGPASQVPRLIRREAIQLDQEQLALGLDSHLVEALRRAIGDERSDRPDLAPGVAAPGDAEGLLELLAGWAFEEAGQDLERSTKLVAVYGYVSNNRRAIENYAIVPMASSGPMEKAVDIVVARRFKARGMSWFRRGVSALVRLRLLRLNGTWDRYWSERFSTALRAWPSQA